MKIQNILFPKAGICTQEKMFFRRGGKTDKRSSISEDDQVLIFDAQEKCSFDTYFNGLSVGKWKKYTNISNFKICIYLQGAFEVSLTNFLYAEGKEPQKQILESRIIKTERKELFTFDYDSSEFNGMFSFDLKALESKSRFFGGWYDGEIKKKDLCEANIAINICTFKREDFVKRNIAILKRNILENEVNPLQGHLRVYISDNGKTLELDQLNDKNICIVYNKNAGGAGGFTRGLLEIMKHKDEFPATHALMMDDDIIIEPEALFRTYILLCCLKEEYKDAFIGGAMLRLDKQNIQVESGASWNAGDLISNKKDLDVNELKACLFNEVEEYTEYNAWWYCCTPMSVVNSENLPLPIFIRGDDLEYGLRNMKTLILMNGICVWHEAFENKYSSFLSYYILRNMLYDNALHFPEYKLTSFLKRLYGHTIRELFYYRYKNIDLIFRGVNDYFKGVQFLVETDGEKLHQEIMAAGYKPMPIEQLGNVHVDINSYQDSLAEEDRGTERFLRLLTFNGYLLPSRSADDNNLKAVSMSNCRPVNFFRQARVLQYDPASNKGFITERDICKAIAVLFELATITLKTVVKFSGLKTRFRRESRQIMKEKFWYKYLDMN